MKIKNLFKPENWWILILASIIFWMMFTIFTNPEYNKDYYSDNELKPTEELFLSISIVPLATLNTPSAR